MGDKSQEDQDKATAAALAQADEQAEAEKAREKQRRAEKEKAEKPHLHDANYVGPLTGDQAVARLAKFGPLAGRETKPATVQNTKAAK